MNDDREIVGEGTPEHAWQAWSGLGQLRPMTVCALLPPGARTVVVSPHPDDEVLATGGVLAMLARLGRPVCVVAVTDGDASHPGSTLWPAARLAVERRRESLAGLSLLRLAPHARQALGLPDGQVHRHIAALSVWLEGFLKAHDVVVSPWEWDGHPDHEASARATSRACAVVGALHLQAPVWMWHWAAPGDGRVPWARMVRVPLDADALDRKQRALLAHRTQLHAQDTGRPAVLAPSSTRRLLRAHEYFILPA